MAIALGPLLLVTVVGAAVFGGLDVRKKKKKNGGVPASVNGGEPPNGVEPESQIVTCAHVIDVNADGSFMAIDGSGWFPSKEMAEFPLLALQEQKPIVAFFMCEADPMVLQALEDLCMQQPGIEFFGVYIHRFPDGPIYQNAMDRCLQENSLVNFGISTPISATQVRTYSSDDIPELNFQPGGNIAQVFANVLAATAGTADPRSEIWEAA